MARGPHSPATKPLSLMPQSSALVQAMMLMMLMMRIGRATPSLIMLVFTVNNNKDKWHPLKQIHFIGRTRAFYKLQGT